MPGLSGSQAAYLLAVTDVARADSTRAGYFLRNAIPVWINGASRPGTILSSIRIDLNTGNEPHHCSLDFKGGSGFVPQAGQTIVIGHGTTASPVFSGRLIQVTRTALRADDRRPVYRCEAAGHLFEMGMSRAQYLYATSLSARSLVLAIDAVSSPRLSTAMGFDFAHVSADAGIVGEFTLSPTDELPDVFDRLFKSIDATWYVDHQRQMWAFQGVNSFGRIPSTLTTNSATFWGLEYQPTDMSRVFTVTHIIGPTQATLADMDPTRQVRLPLPSASLINGGTHVLVGEKAHPFGDYTVTNLTAGITTGQASVFGIASVAATSLTVVGANVSSFTILQDGRWFEIGGQYIYVNSTVGVFSASAQSIAYTYHVYASGPGAIASDIQHGAEIANVWNLTINSALTVAGAALIPAGTRVSAYIVDEGDYVFQVRSLLNNSALGRIPKTFSDDRLSVVGMGQWSDALLERAAPDQWRSLEFVTRDPNYDIGVPVFVNISSVAESGASSINGAFTAHDVTIGGFGRLTETKGPERTVSAGAVRKPAFWKFLKELPAPQFDRIHRG